MNYEMESKQAKDFGNAFSITKTYASRLQHPLGQSRTSKRRRKDA